MTDSLNAPETKAHSPEAHAEHDRMMQIFESFREANDERFAEIEKRMSGDVLTEEKVDRIAKALDEQERRVERLAMKSMPLSWARSMTTCSGSRPRSMRLCMHS